MAFPSNQALHFKRNIFKSLLAPMSRDIRDPKTGALVYYFKMTWKSQLFVYADEQKQQLLLNCKRNSLVGFTWNVLDSTTQDKPLGHIKKNILKTMSQLGAESWEITSPDGTPLLLFEKDASNTTSKRIMDEMLGAYYNPSHQYNIYNAQKKPIARIWSKHGLWTLTYDLVFEDKVTEVERKMVVGIFAALTLILKK